MTDERPPISRFASWRQCRRLRKAARLLKRQAISELDYAVVAADVITRVRDGRPIAVQDRLTITFHLEGLLALGIRGENFDSPEAARYGPLDCLTNALETRFPARGGTGDYTDEWDFVWGDQCADQLWRSQRRLRLWGRLVQRYDRWRRQQTEFAPAAYEDLRRALLWLVGAVMGFVLGALS